jgi:hypothetical protein
MATYGSDEKRIFWIFRDIVEDLKIMKELERDFFNWKNRVF